MFYIGCHLSASQGFVHMLNEALSIGANTFQFFTRNPRGGKAKNIDFEDMKKFIELSKKNNFGKIIAHAPYTLNACSSDPSIRKFAQEMMSDDIYRMDRIPNNDYNFHPGRHTGQGIDIGIKQISSLLNKILKPETKTIILLETMAGKGSEIGGKFEEIKQIIDKVELKEKLGVCLDTCHIFDGGYDIINNLDGVLKEFDQIIGLSNLKFIHLNDSLNDFKSHKDRHAKIGFGNIGIDAISKIIN